METQKETELLAKLPKTFTVSDASRIWKMYVNKANSLISIMEKKKLIVMTRKPEKVAKIGYTDAIYSKV